MFKHLARFVAALAIATGAWAAQAAAVDVNQASQAELESVKGIGPGLSGKIVEARKSGAFKDWSDFVGRVGGVGPGNAAKFSQAGLTVGGAAYAAAPTAAKESKPAAPSEKAPKLRKADASK